MANAAEIRDRLSRIRRTREAGDLEVAEIIRDAARNDRRDILRAVEQDPMRPHDPVVSEDVISEAVAIHVRTRFPDRAEELEAQERAADWLETNLQRADEVARELAGAPLIENGAGDGISEL